VSAASFPTLDEVRAVVAAVRAAEEIAARRTIYLNRRTWDRIRGELGYGPTPPKGIVITEFAPDEMVIRVEVDREIKGFGFRW
jgi:hypothetical protein